MACLDAALDWDSMGGKWFGHEGEGEGEGERRREQSVSCVGGRDGLFVFLVRDCEESITRNK